MLFSDQVVHIDAERLGEGRQGPARAGPSAPLDLLQVERVVLRIQVNQQEPHGATADFDLVRLVNAVEAGREPWTVSLQFMFLQGRLAFSTVFSQLFPFVAITRFWGVCFRSQRLRLARLMDEFFDGFFTVVAATAMLY